MFGSWARSLFIIGTLLVTASLSPGCSTGVRQAPGETQVQADKEIPAVIPLLHQRIPLYKADILPSGDIIKRWRWREPWEVRTIDGSVIRRMYSPDWSLQTAEPTGPHITVIHDPQRGTIYEAYFVQKTEKTFNLPMTLYFFATRESQSPLFSLSFTDAATAQCQAGRVSRGSIQFPGIPLTVFEAAQWIGIGWQSATYGTC